MTKQRLRCRLPAFLLGLACLMVATTPLVPLKAVANPEVSSLTGVRLDSDMAKNGVLEVDIPLQQTRAKADYIKAVQDLRRDLYNENIVLNGKRLKGMTLQEYAGSKGYHDAESYARAFSWSKDMEKVAIQRAAESYVHGKPGHERAGADGNNIFTAWPSWARVMGENLAWCPTTRAAVYDGWGMGEKEALIAGQGDFGHLETLLDLDFQSHGYADIAQPVGRYAGVQAGAYAGACTIEGDAEGTGLDGTKKAEVAVGPLDALTNKQDVEEEHADQPADIIRPNDQLYTDEEKVIEEGRPGLVQTPVKNYYYNFQGQEVLVKQERGQQVVIHDAKATVKEVGTKPIVTTAEVKEEETVPCTTETVERADLYEDHEKILNPGKDGLVKKTIEITYTKGVETGRKVVGAETVVEMQPKQVEKGTKKIVATKDYQVDEAIPFETKQQLSAELYTGETKTVQKGEDGILRKFYRKTFNKEQEVSDELLRTETVKPAKDEIKAVGTKAVTTTIEIKEDVKVPFTTEIIKRDDLYQDHKKEIQAGKDGLVRKTFKVTYTKGEETGRELIGTKTIQEMQIQKIEQGTKVRPTPSELKEPELINAPPTAWILNKVDQTFVIRINSDLANLQKVVLNDQVLGKDAYKTEAGSTVISLTPAYLNRLAPGGYTLSVSFKADARFKAGEVKHHFVVKADAGSKPGTKANTPGSNKLTKSTETPGKSTTKSKQKGRQLPRTGQVSVYTAVGAAGLLLVAAGVSLFVRKQQKQ